LTFSLFCRDLIRDFFSPGLPLLVRLLESASFFFNLSVREFLSPNVFFRRSPHAHFVSRIVPSVASPHPFFHPSDLTFSGNLSVFRMDFLEISFFPFPYLSGPHSCFFRTFMPPPPSSRLGICDNHPRFFLPAHFLFFSLAFCRS